MKPVHKLVMFGGYYMPPLFGCDEANKMPEEEVRSSFKDHEVTCPACATQTSTGDKADESR